MNPKDSWGQAAIANHAWQAAHAGATTPPMPQPDAANDAAKPNSGDAKKPD